jgi:hypothetical protein
MMSTKSSGTRHAQLLDSSTYRVVCAQFWELACDTSSVAAVPLRARPTFAALRAGPWCDHGLRSLSIVAATIGDVATAAMQPTYLLAAICRADWVGWTRRMRRWRLTGGHRFRLACSICQCCSFTIGE